MPADGELQRDQGFESEEAEDRELEAFIGRLLADPRVDLPPAVVIDVGCITGAGWACVELNAAWGVGIYGCDPKAALQVIGHASVRRSQAPRFRRLSAALPPRVRRPAPRSAMTRRARGTMKGVIGTCLAARYRDADWAVAAGHGQVG